MLPFSVFRCGFQTILSFVWAAQRLAVAMYDPDTTEISMMPDTHETEDFQLLQNGQFSQHNLSTMKVGSMSLSKRRKIGVGLELPWRDSGYYHLILFHYILCVCTHLCGKHST